MTTNYPVPRVTITDPALDRPAGPPSEDPVDHATMLRYAEQQAARDKDTIDDIYVRYQEGRAYPGEEEAARRLERETHEARQGLSDAKSLGEALKKTASVSLTVNGKGVQKDLGTTVAIEKKTVKEVAAQLVGTLAERDSLTKTLVGQTPASDGIMWTGSVPPKPSPDTTKRQIHWSAANLKAKALIWGPIIGLGSAEGAIVIGTIKDYLRTDNYLMVIGFGLAILVGLIGLPGFLGQVLAKCFHRGFAMVKELTTLIAWGLVWLLAVGSTVFFRVSADRDKAIRVAAEAKQVPLDQVDAAAVYNIPAHIAVWSAAVILIGAIVIIAKVMFYNPVVTDVIKTDLHLVDLYRSRFLHASILEQGKALIKARVAAADAVVAQWDHYIDDTLPAHKKEFCVHYRNWLARYMGDPNITNGLFDSEV